MALLQKKGEVIVCVLNFSLVEHVCVCMYVYMCVHVCMHVYMCVIMFAYVSVCMWWG